MKTTNPFANFSAALTAGRVQWMTPVLVALLWTAAASPSLAITYTTLDYPGSLTTFANDIDGNNIVGAYRDSLSIFHGFLYNGATYTTLDYPGSLSTFAFGIDGNNIVGFYTGPSGGHGFLYDGTTYTALDYPLVTGVTNAFGIDGNNIVGAYTTGSSGSSGFHGFLATVPEPSSGVLGVIACGLTWWRRKRFK